MDYSVHTLENAAMILNSPKFFSNRASMSDAARKQISNVARRLQRITAHARSSHPEIFQEFEVIQ
jgi:hypothetical protein